MIILQENEVCPFVSACPYNKLDGCIGGHYSRNTRFECSYVNNKGVFIQDGIERSNLDQTGNMKIIME